MSSIEIKRHRANWGFWSFEDNFDHNDVSVPNDCYDWQDDLSHSLQGCLEGICQKFNKFSDKAWEEIKKCQDIGIEDIEPYQSRIGEIEKMRIKV